MTSLNVPESLDEEHGELLGALTEYSALDGKTGAVVKELLGVLRPHFEEENRLVMPLLGLLGGLAEKKPVADASSVKGLSTEYAKAYDGMFAEHVEIRRFLEKAKRAADAEGRREVVDTLEALAHHARVEEDVLYPAALVAGRIVSGSEG